MSQDVGSPAAASDQRAVPWRALSAMVLLAPLMLLGELPAIDLPVDLWPAILVDILPAISAVGILGLATWTVASVGPHLVRGTGAQGVDRGTRPARGEVELLQQEAEATRELIDSAVHELASPLTTMAFQLHALRASAADRLEDDDLVLLDHVADDLARFEQRVSDLQDSARVQGGRLEVETYPLDLGRIVRRQGERYQAEAEAQGVALSVDIDQAPRVEADPDRLIQILCNLLSNAIGYTPAGGQVHVTAHQADGVCTVEVCDTGLGLDEHDLATIFEPYVRAHEGVEDAKDGTGLGLHIARRLAKAHGGQLTAKSPGRGQGSTFTLTLPMAPPTGSTDGPDGAGDRSSR